MDCPKCRGACPAGIATCPACGLVLANYDPLAQTLRRQQRLQARQNTARTWRTLAAIAAGVFVIGACVVWWTGRPSPQAFVPPTEGGRVFSGLAHGHEGAAADVYLVKAGHTVQKVGGIAAGGRFHFELPTRLDLLRLTVVQQQLLRNMGDGQGEANARTRARIAQWPSEPASAVHALRAGEGWSELAVEPLELNAARYELVYANDSGQGDLFIANHELGFVSTPGQAMVVLVYADRPGRVRGVAQTTNGFGVLVPYTWELDLQAGWNLVTSEQAWDMATLRYRTGALPEGMEWWTRPIR